MQHNKPYQEAQADSTRDFFAKLVEEYKGKCHALTVSERTLMRRKGP
jgi:hypothetical protein